MSLLGGAHQNTPDEQAMVAQAEAQLRSDPRFLNWAGLQGGRGMRTAKLSDFIPGAPDGWTVSPSGKVSHPEHASLPTIIGAGALATGGLGALGIGPLAGGGSGGYVADAVNGVQNSIYGGAAAAGAGAGLGTAAANGGSAASGLAGTARGLLTNPQTYAGLAGLITALASKPNGGGAGAGDPFATNPQLQHMLDIASQRVDRTDPLHQAVTQLAMNRLPTNVQR